MLSVATVQKHLHPAGDGAPIELRSYLSQLCSSLAGCMIKDDSCTIGTNVSEGAVTSATAVSIGLIVTERVINALKHAFPETKPGCAIVVSYEINGADWKLSVSDNGVGVSSGDWPPAKSGLGTAIVNALAAQLNAQVDTVSLPTGTIVSVARATFKSLPEAA